MWATILLFKGTAPDRFRIYTTLVISTFMAVGIYYYALYGNVSIFKYFIYMYIFVSFIIAFLEVNFALILPTSGKNVAEGYHITFKNIPTSTFYNPNDFATAIGMLFVYIYSYCKMRRYNIRYLILLCCLYIAFFTGSRGVQLAILLLPLAYSIINKKPIRKLLLSYLIMLSFILLIIKSNYLPDYNISKYSDTVDSLAQGGIDSSSMWRLVVIVYTFANLGKLVIGLGSGGSLLFLDPFPIKNPHNFFIEILIDYCFIGLILSISIFVFSLKMNYMLIKENISDNLKDSCKATIILLYSFILFSVVSSGLLNSWSFAWFPVYLTLINLGTYKRIYGK
jgi:hypothetical protein